MASRQGGFFIGFRTRTGSCVSPTGSRATYPALCRRRGGGLRSGGRTWRNCQAFPSRVSSGTNRSAGQRLSLEKYDHH